jgi:hypothetical protein
MSGALKGVFGGGGIFGAVLNIAGMLFPPLQIMNALSNMLTQAIGGAVSGAIDYAMKELGMPKFLGNALKGAVQGALPGLMQENNPQAASAVRDRAGKAFDDFQKSYMSDMTDALKRYKSDAEKSGQAGGKASGKSWFVALMMALGEVQNKQAAKVQQLAKEVSEVLGSGDDSAGSRQAQFDKMEEFKAEAKLQEMFANISKSVGDSLGNSLTTVLRSQ